MAARCRFFLGECLLIAALAGVLVSIPFGRAWAQHRCPQAHAIPQLTIDRVNNPAIPVIDDWQIIWRDTPISDAQLAALAQNDPAIELTRKEMEGRGAWVYVGMLGAAVGAAISCVGWYLQGSSQDSVPQPVSLGMALGGLLVGGGGVLLVTESIQGPMEPHLAPTPRHRLSREEARRLVAVVNQRLYDEVCRAAEKVVQTSSSSVAPTRGAVASPTPANEPAAPAPPGDEPPPPNSSTVE